MISINYTVQKTNKPSDYYVLALFQDSQEATETLFAPGMDSKNMNAQGNPNQQQQGKKSQGEKVEEEQPTGIIGFVKKNMWYIGIGLVVLMTLNKQPEPQQGGQQQQQKKNQ
ncbi:hypothetical protein PPERSA_12699 [Pseudocohnilembus persalinus]|uniref:Uncharacterized protein n=1 Tax=Pseudocohnilembus persalinus TaxID=266149 RepID=A0A0V0QTJ3_PSEPJ|nr:hypothetical protein PPERSA_12699 [Pseudocohnilembus persalinus]|eukprot:KRX05521.1 hypothetical protein PPERSA_12699 [Pseudocohnilembus persalinus]